MKISNSISAKNSTHIQKIITKKQHPWATTQPTCHFKHFLLKQYQIKHQVALQLKPNVAEGEVPEKSGHMLFSTTYSGDQRSLLRIHSLSKEDGAALNHIVLCRVYVPHRCKESSMDAYCSQTKGKSNPWSGSQR